MGSSSSKAVRKLPTSPSVSRSAHPPPPPPPPPPPSQARSTLPPRYEASEFLDQQQTSTSRSAFDYGSSSVPESSGQGQDVLSDRNKSMASNEVRGGMGKVRFSGEKDDAVKQDAMDPQFMRNLGRLGQVRIHDAGEFVPAQAQRTLASRSAAAASEASLTPSSTAPKHLHMSTLVSLLDRLKTTPKSDIDRIYAEYGMDRETMDVVRKWVNSVSVSDEDTVRVEDGEEVREMNARWVGGVDR